MNTALTTSPTAVGRETLARLEAAWNAGDGEAWGAAYAPDATFVTIRGDYLVGSAAIGEGHAGIFRTIYAGSVNRLELVQAIELAEDVLLVSALATLDCPAGPLAGIHRARSTNVVTRNADGRWLIAATHNTLVAG